MTDDPVQLLSPDGELRHHPAYPLRAGGAELRGLYRDMVLARRADAEAVALQRQGELGIWPSMLGQEAAQVGSARAMRAGDFAFPSYREHAVAWCRDVPLVDLLAVFRGVRNGGWDPHEHNFNQYSLVIGSHLLHAVGYAMGVQRSGEDRAVVAYFGDGASSQGDALEAFVFAASFNAPVVFYCQNNQWAISEPVSVQSRTPLYRRADGFGFPGVRVDGNDVLACLAATRIALEHARTGGGPFLIEAFTYRMAAHTTSDDPTRYRPAEEIELWQARDPIRRVATCLERQRWADPGFFDAVDADAEDLALRLRADCLGLRDPDPRSVLDHVYSSDHAQVERERTWLTEYLDGFADVAVPAAGGGNG